MKRLDNEDIEQRSIKKHTELWDEIKNQIETIHEDKQIEYGRDFRKIWFESDDDLPWVKY